LNINGARSMTGFAQVRRVLQSGGEAVVSLKSVNHRGLDLHFHMAPWLDAFEPTARAAVRKRVGRGHLQIQVSVNASASEAGGVLNTALLERWMTAFREAARILDVPVSPDVNAALRVPGMLQAESGAEWTPELEHGLTECFEQALDGLNAFREREGAAIADEVAERARAVDDLATRMQEIRVSATAAFHRRLNEKLSELLRGSAVEPQRLAQEAAILADRSDISEEIMRLKTHAREALELIGANGEKGKKLDFLLQEMNREANTVLSKTGGLGDQGLTLTNLALGAKAEIDKMREQALNLE
jgi:uncharacterized protein (TIGR00255 family)